MRLMTWVAICLALTACTSPDRTRIDANEGKELHDFIHGPPSKEGQRAPAGR